MSFFENVKAELKSQKLRIADLSRGASIPDGTLRTYDRRGALPSIDVAVKIAEYLGVSLDYLATGQAAKDFTLTHEERELVLQFRRLDDRDKNAITTLCESLLSQYSDSTKRTITVG